MHWSTFGPVLEVVNSFKKKSYSLFFFFKRLDVHYDWLEAKLKKNILLSALYVC
jgi:hypothetical protein